MTTRGTDFEERSPQILYQVWWVSPSTVKGMVPSGAGGDGLLPRLPLADVVEVWSAEGEFCCPKADLIFESMSDMGRSS